jgi:hypothetical protein
VKLDIIQDFGARIDLLLKNESGQYVIFDFKWSYGKQFEDKLKDDLSIQLDLYKQAVTKTYKDKTVAGVGYYLMPKKQLITTDFEEIPEKNLIKHIDKLEEIVKLKDKIAHSYNYRMDEIMRGHIEEAEMMDILDVECYYKHQDDENNELCPLSVEIKASGRGRNRVITAILKNSEKVYRPSKKPSFDDDSKEPSETPTSHPVLKGRLK